MTYKRHWKYRWQYYRQTDPNSGEYRPTKDGEFFFELLKTLNKLKITKFEPSLLYESLSKNW